jgi:hypothetical protein
MKKKVIGILATLALSLPTVASAQFWDGGKYNAKTGDRVYTKRDSQGNTHVVQQNSRTGYWKRSWIDSKGNQRGSDSNGERHSYRSYSGKSSGNCFFFCGSKSKD